MFTNNHGTFLAAPAPYHNKSPFVMGLKMDQLNTVFILYVHFINGDAQKDISSFSYNFDFLWFAAKKTEERSPVSLNYLLQ